MEHLLYNISLVLGISIIHSLWQGSLVYFVLRIAFAFAPAMSPVKKYNFAVIAMFIIIVCFVYTIIEEVYACNRVNTGVFKLSAPLLSVVNLPVNITHLGHGRNDVFAAYLPYIAVIYIAGLIVNLFKLSREYITIKRIKQSLLPAQQMQQYINKLSRRLDIRTFVNLNFSEMIDVPCVIGYFKPVILLPVSLATNLSACEIESILLHELAHIKRNDYLLNLLQQVVIAVLFFNPFAQLINRIINQERENGCDDLVIEKTGKPLIYAGALLKLEETRTTRLQLALAATGKKYLLLNRIERIMNTTKTTGSTRHLLMVMLFLAAGASSIAWFSPKIPQAKIARQKIGVQAHTCKTNIAPSAAHDTSKYIAVDDTVKHNRRPKFVIFDKDGIRKEYYSKDSLPLSVRKQLDSMDRFYSSPKWKSQMEAIKKQRDQIKKQFDGPEWKAEVEAMKKQGEDMNRQFSSPEWKTQIEAMKTQAEEIKKQFDSPQWKSRVLTMQKQSEEMARQFNSPEWKAQMEAMKTQGEEIKKQFDSPEWKEQLENIKKQAEELNKQFNSPEWKAQMEEMKKQSGNPDWKERFQEWKNDDEDGSGKADKPEVKHKAAHLKPKKQPVN